MCDENLQEALPQTGSNACSSSPASVETQPSSRVPLPHQSAVQLPSFVFDKPNTPRIPRKVTIMTRHDDWYLIMSLQHLYNSEAKC